MAATATRPDLRKGSKVRNTTVLRDVPEGTTGKVILVNGFAWTRYWVRFDNGISLGTIDRSVLATADEWKRHLAGEDLTSDGAEVASDTQDAAAADEGASEGKATPSGTMVPQKLLDRAAAARTRLGG